MEDPKAGFLVVTLEIDPEQLGPLQGALAFLADVCLYHGIDNTGAVRSDSPERKHYGDALGYVTYIAAQIGEAVLDN